MPVSDPLQSQQKDPDLARLVELWERLPEAGRKLLRQTAETLAENCLGRDDNRPRLGQAHRMNQEPAEDR